MVLVPAGKNGTTFNGTIFIPGFLYVCTT
jgi:hypothetical protein